MLNYWTSGQKYTGIVFFNWKPTFQWMKDILKQNDWMGLISHYNVNCMLLSKGQQCYQCWKFILLRQGYILSVCVSQEWNDAYLQTLNTKKQLPYNHLLEEKRTTQLWRNLSAYKLSNLFLVPNVLSNEDKVSYKETTDSCSQG